jgi:hypothetical protein
MVLTGVKRRRIFARRLNGRHVVHLDVHLGLDSKFRPDRNALHGWLLTMKLLIYFRKNESKL